MSIITSTMPTFVEIPSVDAIILWQIRSGCLNSWWSEKHGMNIKCLKTSIFIAYCPFSILYILGGLWERTANKFWIKLQDVHFPMTKEVVTSCSQYHTVPKPSPDTSNFFKVQKEVMAWGGKHQWRQHEPFPPARKGVYCNFPSLSSSIQQTHQAFLPSSCHPLAITLRTVNISVLE